MKYEVLLDFGTESLSIDADSKEAAEDKAIEMYLQGKVDKPVIDTVQSGEIEDAVHD